MTATIKEAPLDKILNDCLGIIHMHEDRGAKATVRHDLAAYVLPEKAADIRYVRVYEWVESRKKRPRGGDIPFLMQAWALNKLSAMNRKEMAGFKAARERAIKEIDSRITKQE